MAIETAPSHPVNRPVGQVAVGAPPRELPPANLVEVSIAARNLGRKPAARVDGAGLDRWPPRLRVLLVDDEEMVRSTVARCLERLGFVVTATSSGSEALDAADGATFDVILADQQMPGMSGAELIARLLERDPSLRHRIVVTSGDLHSASTRTLLETTGCRGIQKPFPLAELALALRAAGQGVRSER